ncbi:hypothetical protein ACUODF_36295, partial [Escherichia coli]
MNNLIFVDVFIHIPGDRYERFLIMETFTLLFNKLYCPGSILKHNKITTIKKNVDIALVRLFKCVELHNSKLDLT